MKPLIPILLACFALLSCRKEKDKPAHSFPGALYKEITDAKAGNYDIFKYNTDGTIYRWQRYINGKPDSLQEYSYDNGKLMGIKYFKRSNDTWKYVFHNLFTYDWKGRLYDLKVIDMEEYDLDNPPKEVFSPDRYVYIYGPDNLAEQFSDRYHYRMVNGVETLYAHAFVSRDGKGNINIVQQVYLEGQEVVFAQVTAYKYLEQKNPRYGAEDARDIAAFFSANCWSQKEVSSATVPDRIVYRNYSFNTEGKPVSFKEQPSGSETRFEYYPK
ncbi:MAG: hypothetical protein P0Y53_00215 [Candidatus Pseudobacter hemicellulosilyticus]|uniref:Uncharacterized protein n=1 Tax=Candidatus Pseudobacter hemicellulosilyticus TaxID=3121375 RepID=A0AAJ5WSJ9_9BACT|nr:MAG: hypothetical protein P0Y53_00215 [Pseudobacter sp.]